MVGRDRLFRLEFYEEERGKNDDKEFCTQRIQRKIS